MSEVWNNVTVYGPAVEIERFKRLCVGPSGTEYTTEQSGWDGGDGYILVPSSGDRPEAPISYSEYVWNFQQFFPASGIEYSFSFDSDHDFPEQLFGLLAERFPTLAFHCSCIASLDEFMGYGWFNPPTGGELFAQDYNVPKDYWTGGGGQKRSLIAEAEHAARIGRLKEALRNT